MKRVLRIALFALLGVVGAVLLGLVALIWTFAHDLPRPGEVMAEARQVPGYLPLSKMSPYLQHDYPDKGGLMTPMRISWNAIHLARWTLAKRSVRGLDWHFKGLILSFWLDRTIPAEQLQEALLNTRYFAPNLFGIGPAAKAYFGKTPDQLSIAEAALLLAVSHRRFNCRRHFETIVDSMPLTPEEKAAALAEPLPPNPNPYGCPNPPTP